MSSFSQNNLPASTNPNQSSGGFDGMDTNQDSSPYHDLHASSADTDAAPAPGYLPAHHVHHGSSEPLPGASGARPAADYSTETMEGMPSSALSATQGTSNAGQKRPYAVATERGQGANAFNSERPLGVQPTAAGGVAIGGRDDLPEGKANLGDKIVGKTQKVIGKYTNNPELHEKGELRESGGKAAAHGQARAPHD